MTTTSTLSARKELEIGVAIASELIDYLWDGKLTSNEIRETLREVVREVGIGHTDEYFAEMVIHRLRHDLAGRI